MGRCRRADSRGTAALLSTRCRANMRPRLSACWASWWCTPPETERWPIWLSSTWFLPFIKRKAGPKRDFCTGPFQPNEWRVLTNRKLLRCCKECGPSIPGTSSNNSPLLHKDVQQTQMIYSVNISRLEFVYCPIFFVYLLDTYVGITWFVSFLQARISHE